MSAYDCSDCYILIFFFADSNLCHVSVSQSEKRAVSAIRRKFSNIGFDVVDVVSFYNGNAMEFQKIEDKYTWRLVMHYMGFDIINQDGSIFSNVKEETREAPTMRAIEIFGNIYTHILKQAVKFTNRKKISYFPDSYSWHCLQSVISSGQIQNINAMPLSAKLVSHLGIIKFKEQRYIHEFSKKIKIKKTSKRVDKIKRNKKSRKPASSPKCNIFNETANITGQRAVSLLTGGNVYFDEDFESFLLRLEMEVTEADLAAAVREIQINKHMETLITLTCETDSRETRSMARRLTNELVVSTAYITGETPKPVQIEDMDSMLNGLLEASAAEK